MCQHIWYLQNALVALYHKDVDLRRKHGERKHTLPTIFWLNLQRHHLPLVGYLRRCIISPLRLCSFWTRTSVSSRGILFDTAGLDFPHSSLTVTVGAPWRGQHCILQESGELVCFATDGQLHLLIDPNYPCCTPAVLLLYLNRWF